MIDVRFQPPDAGAIRFRRMRDFSEILRATTALLRENASALFPAVVLIAGPLMLLSSFLSASVDLTPDGDMAMVGSLLLATPLTLLALIVLYAVVFGFLMLYRDGRVDDASVSAIWQEARSLVGPFIGLNLAVGLVFGLGTFVLVLVAVAMMGVGGALAVLLGIGTFILFVIGMLAVFAAVFVAHAVRAFEDEGAFASLGRGFRLIRQRPGRSLGVAFVTGMLVIVALSVVGVVLGVLSVWFGDGLISDAVLSVVTTVLYLLAYPLPIVAGAFLYDSLVAELEGTALDDELAVFEQAEPMPRSPWPADVPATAPAAAPSTSEATLPDDDARPSGFRGGGFGG